MTVKLENIKCQQGVVSEWNEKAKMSPTSMRYISRVKKGIRMKEGNQQKGIYWYGTRY